MKRASRKKSKVLIIDDHPIYLQGLELALEDSFFLEVVDTYSIASEAKKYLVTHPVDIVVCDINMPIFDGFDILKTVVNKTKAKLLFISGLNDAFTIKRAYKLGAYGYVPKDAHVLEIFKALDTIRKGEKYTTPDIDKVLLDGAIGAKQNPAEKPLTPQETLILRKICSELTSEQIAKDLAISIHTVNNHRKSILKKTKCTNLVSLAKYAAQNGLME